MSSDPSSHYNSFPVFPIRKKVANIPNIPNLPNIPNIPNSVNIPNSPKKKLRVIITNELIQELNKVSAGEISIIADVLNDKAMIAFFNSMTSIEAHELLQFMQTEKKTAFVNRYITQFNNIHHRLTNKKNTSELKTWKAGGNLPAESAKKPSRSGVHWYDYLYPVTAIVMICLCLGSIVVELVMMGQLEGKIAEFVCVLTAEVLTPWENTVIIVAGGGRNSLKELKEKAKIKVSSMKRGALLKLLQM